MKIHLLCFLLVASLSATYGQSRKAPQGEAGSSAREKKVTPPKDPKLASFYIKLKTSSRAAEVTPVVTTRPLK